MKQFIEDGSTATPYHFIPKQTSESPALVPL
jgi:hypothetical protein